MSAPFLNPTGHPARDVDWARMIPGELPPHHRSRKKPSQSVGSAARDNVFKIWTQDAGHQVNEPLARVLPQPLQSRAAWRVFSSIVTDFTLVELNWLLIGAGMTLLATVLPMRLASIPSSRLWLVGIGLLHGALITLVGYTELLYSSETDLRGQFWALGKSVLLASTFLATCCGLLMGLVTCELVCLAGLLHFSSLLISRWQEARFSPSSEQALDTRNVLIVSAGPVGYRIAKYLEQHPESNRKVCGFLDESRPLGDGVLGRIRELARVARTCFIDEVILAAPEDRDLTLRVLHEARRLRLDVEIVPELFGCDPGSSELGHIGMFPAICVHAEKLPAAGFACKRLIDVLGASSALIFLSPLLALIAAVIKLDSPGPILYAAARAGRKGQLFRCYKFRTMVSDADSQKEKLRKENQRTGPFFKMADDPRITRVGHILRRYSLDELPQLWNVLKGEMSLVGPRPHPLDDVAAYEIEHLARLDVTPGITGLWQVTARRDPSFQLGMDLDREYIRGWSLKGDLAILARTLVAVVKGSGE